MQNDRGGATATAVSAALAVAVATVIACLFYSRGDHGDAVRGHGEYMHVKSVSIKTNEYDLPKYVSIYFENLWLA